MSGILDGISKKNTETNDVTESYWGGPSPAQLRFNRALKKQQNSPENKADREKFQKEIDRIMGPRPVQPKDEPEDKEITEAFDQPYSYEWDKPDPRSYHALAFLDDGSPLDIEFNRQGNNEWHVKFDRNYSYKVTGEGNQQRVFATVIAAMKEFVKKRKPQKVVFSATKTVAPGQKSTSRSSLYSSLISRFATALGYTAHIDDQGDQVVYELTKVQKPVTESSGTTAAGYTWSFEPGREVPMKSDVDANTFIRVRDAAGKTICGIWADVEGDSIEIEYSQVFDERLRGRGVYTDLLRSLSKQYTVISDKDNNNAAAGIYRRLGADYDHRQATHTLRKQSVAEGLDQDVPPVLYHATYKPRLKNIKLKGLGAGGKPNWEDSQRGVVYLALDPNVAESYAEASDMVPEEWLDSIVILSISTTGLDSTKFQIDSNVQDNEGDTVEYHGIIPPSNISLYKQGVAEGEHAPSSLKTMVDVGGIQLNVAIDGAEVSIRPVVDGYQAGYVVFDRDGRTLVPDDLAIDDEVRGRGIAKIIYDYVKSLGFTIRRSSDQTRAGKHFWDKNRGEDGMIWEGTDYMAGHCHVMAIALQQLHPDWQLRAHIGWDEEAEDEEEYRVDHIYIVAPDGTAYDCRGKFANEEKLVGPDETGGVETQFVDIDLQEINNLVQRGELKRFTKQEVEKAIIFIQRQEKELDEACWKGYHKEGMKTMFGKRYPNCVKNTKEDIEENHRIARKPGQPAKSKAHSDLYTDEDPKGTIHGLKFATVDDAHASVAKIKSSGRSHAHKIQAAVAMEQRAKAAGKSSAAAVYRSYINGAKKTNESTEESCPHCNGPMFSEELINEKKDACYYKVKSRYKVWPSAYASGALVQCRKKGASNWGTKSESSILEGIEQTDEDLHKWFKEKWVRFGPDGKIRGACARGDDSEGKPKCLPQSKAQNLGKKGRASAASRKRREDPNPERSGKAINVATKKKTTESSILQGISETKGLPMPGSYEQEYGPFKKKGGYRIMTLTSEQEELDEKWSDKYKRSIDCNHPKGFSQRAHCQGKKKK